MPLYEYYCPTCKTRFELLRPMSRSGELATCPSGHGKAERVVSVFAARVATESGVPAMLEGAGGGGCAGCGPGGCACGH